MKVDETILGRIGKGVDVVRWKINKIIDDRDAMVCKRRRNGIIILQYQNFMKNMLKSLTLICSGENHNVDKFLLNKSTIEEDTEPKQIKADEGTEPNKSKQMKTLNQNKSDEDTELKQGTAICLPVGYS